MSKPLFAISSDWHLERHAWAKHPELAGDAYYGLRQLISYCVHNDLALVAPGDLFEKSYPDAYSVGVACREMDRMESAGLPVYYTQGQHEMARDQPWLGIHLWPQHVHKQLFSIGDYKLYGLDYQRADSIKSELQAIPESADIFVGHQVWHDFMGNVTRPECASSDVPHVRYIITGDFHKLVLASGIGASQQELKIISPGPLCLQALNEPAEKFFLVFHEDGYISRHQLRVRPVYKHVLEQGIDWDAWQYHLDKECPPDDSLPESLRKPILHIRYPSDLPEAFDRITKIAGERYHLFLNPISEKLPDIMLADADERTDQINVDLRTCLGRTCDAMFGAETQKREEVYSCVLRLLDSPSDRPPREELQAMESLFLQEGSLVGDLENRVGADEDVFCASP